MNAVFEGAPEGAPDTRLGRNTGYISDLLKGSFQNCSQGLSVGHGISQPT